MGWFWKDESSSESDKTDSGDGEHGLCTVSKKERTESTMKCITQQVKPGKFVKKCEKTKKITTTRDLNGSSVEVVHFSTEHTEEDVTGERAVCRLM